MSIFKACDIRGTYGEDLTEETAFAIGRAVGTLVRSALAVGGDARRSTPALKEALMRGLVPSGADVVDVGTLTTPALNYALREVVPGLGVMVTASHNPARYNGFKVILGEGPTSPEEIEAVKALVESGRFASGQGTMRRETILPRYADWLVATALPVPDFPVVIDGGGGVAGPVAVEVFERLGARVERLWCEPDPDLSRRDPNPAHPGALAALEERVSETGAALGLAFDGDGDRVIFVDDRGRTASGDLAGAVLVKLVVPRTRAAIVYDLKCSSVLPETATALGFVPKMERSGYAFMRRRMVEEDAVFGCEMSGHLFFGELAGCDDGLYAALGLAGVLAGPRAPRLSEVLASLPRRVATPDLRIPRDPDRVQSDIAALLRAHRDRAPSTLDGIRVEFPQGWALARASVTEPLITLRFEADTDAHLAEVIEWFLGPTPELADAVAARRSGEEGGMEEKPPTQGE